jgi:hypothetical protein
MGVTQDERGRSRKEQGKTGERGRRRAEDSPRRKTRGWGDETAHNRIR